MGVLFLIWQVHLNSHILKFRKCFTKYFRLKCINNKYLCQKQRIVFMVRTRRGVLPSKRLLGMCRWMGSHFHNWTD